jgi:hypothetical protein
MAASSRAVGALYCPAVKDVPDGQSSPIDRCIPPRDIIDKRNSSAASRLISTGRYEDPWPAITVHGGLVQAVEGVPPGIVVRGRDYDIDGTEDEHLDRDDKGHLCCESVWTAGDEADDESSSPPSDGPGT